MDGILSEATVQQELSEESSWEVRSFSSQDGSFFQSESDSGSDEEDGDEILRRSGRKRPTLA